MLNKVSLGRLPTGAPGTGKATLAQQSMLSLASADRKALFFSLPNELAREVIRGGAHPARRQRCAALWGNRRSPAPGDFRTQSAC
ncbi:hypothetical protein AAKU55_001487 [Oxalobacteraceae bacterium GrIS 1.11]